MCCRPSGHYHLAKVWENGVRILYKLLVMWPIIYPSLYIPNVIMVFWTPGGREIVFTCKFLLLEEPEEGSCPLYFFKPWSSVLRSRKFVSNSSYVLLCACVPELCLIGLRSLILLGLVWEASLHILVTYSHDEVIFQTVSPCPENGHWQES